MIQREIANMVWNKSGHLYSKQVSWPWTYKTKTHIYLQGWTWKSTHFPILFVHILTI